MEENVDTRLNWSDKELIAWLRRQDRSQIPSAKMPKSIARAERVLNKIRCRGVVTEIIDSLNTVDMSLYIEELATVLVDSCPSPEDRKWHISYVLICNELVRLYGQRFTMPYLAKIYKTERKMKLLLSSLILFHLGNVFECARDIKSLLVKILENSKNIHSYVQQRKAKGSRFTIMADAVMGWEENQTLHYVNELYHSYAADLFNVAPASPGSLSPAVLDLLTIGLCPNSFKRTMRNALVKYIKQRSIITLLIIYEVYHRQLEEMQANRLRGFNDFDSRQKAFSKYKDDMVQTVLALLNDIALPSSEPEIDAVSDYNSTEPPGAELPAVDVTHQVPSSSSSYSPETPEVSKSVDNQYQFSSPVTAKMLDMTHLIMAAGLLHSRTIQRDAVESSTFDSEDLLSSLVPKLFVEDFPVLFPKLYELYNENKNSKIGVLRLTDNGFISGMHESAQTQSELPVDCQVKWKDEAERYFYETLPDFRSSLPTLHDAKLKEDEDSPKSSSDGMLDDDLMGPNEDTLPSSSQFDSFMSELLNYSRNCGFIDGCTAYCVDEFVRTFFLKLFDTRNNRKRVAKQLLAMPHEPSTLPCLFRFAAVLDANTVSTSSGLILPSCNGQVSLLQPGPILKAVATRAKAQFAKEMKSNSPSKLDVKLQWAIYLSELCKFRAIPIGDVMDNLVHLSQYDVFSISNSAAEVLCTFLENCGRFLAGTYGADIRLLNLIKIIERVRARTRSISPRVDVSLDDQLQILTACCLRMRGEITPLWERLVQRGNAVKSTSPQIQYARYLINEIAAQGLWYRSSEKNVEDHMDSFSKPKSCISVTPDSATRIDGLLPAAGGSNDNEIISFEELVRRLKTLNLKDRRVVMTLIECCLDRNNYSPTNAHMVYFLAELANELPHFVGVCVDELIYRVVYGCGGKQQRLLEVQMISKFLNYKLIDTTVGLDIVSYLIGLAAHPHGASHFRSIFDCVFTSSNNLNAIKGQYPFDFVKHLLHCHGAANLDVVYKREVQEEFEEVRIIEARSRLESMLSYVLFHNKANFHILNFAHLGDEEFFRYKLAIAILRNCGHCIVQRVYKCRLTFMIDILYYCISHALQQTIVSVPSQPINVAYSSGVANSQQLNLKLDFEEMANHLNYPYTDLWDLPLACNSISQFLRQIVREIDENEADFQPLLGSAHSELLGFKSSWVLPDEEIAPPPEYLTESDDHVPLENEQVSPSVQSSTSETLSSPSEEEDNNGEDDSLFDKELNLLVNESLDVAKSTAPRNNWIGEIRLPAKLSSKTSPDGATTQYRLVTRQKIGGKQTFRPIIGSIPALAAAKATEQSDTIMDRQALKRFVLERAMSEDPTSSEQVGTSSYLQYRPSEASALTRQILYQQVGTSVVSNAANDSRRATAGNKRGKRKKQSRIRSRTTTTFITTESSDD